MLLSHVIRYEESPLRFEAGTPAIAEAIGLGAACDYLSGIGMGRVQEAEQQLGTYLYEQVRGCRCWVVVESQCRSRRWLPGRRACNVNRCNAPLC